MELLYKEVVTHFAVGLVMGVALEKSRILDPDVVRCHGHPSWVLVKFWFSAAAVSCVALVLASYVAPEKWIKARKGASGAKRDRIAAAAGAYVTGFGVVLAGAGPATFIAQVGARVGMGRGWWTLLGGFFGALLHSFFEPQLRQAWAPARRDRGRADVFFSSFSSSDHRPGLPSSSSSSSSSGLASSKKKLGTANSMTTGPTTPTTPPPGRSTTSTSTRNRRRERVSFAPTTPNNASGASHHYGPTTIYGGGDTYSGSGGYMTTSPVTMYRRGAWMAFTMLIFVVVCLEVVSPWHREAVRSLKATYPPFFATGGAYARLGSHYGLRAHAWSPTLAGSIVGAIQLPLILVTGHVLAVSEVYVTLLAPALESTDTALSVDVAKRSNLGLNGNAARIALFLALPIGAAVSASRSGLRAYAAAASLASTLASSPIPAPSPASSISMGDIPPTSTAFFPGGGHLPGGPFPTPTVSYVNAFLGGALAVGGSRFAYAGPLATAVSGIACASVPALASAPALVVGGLSARLLFLILGH